MQLHPMQTPTSNQNYGIFLTMGSAGFISSVLVSHFKVKGSGFKGVLRGSDLRTNMLFLSFGPYNWGGGVRVYLMGIGGAEGFLIRFRGLRVYLLGLGG